MYNESAKQIDKSEFDDLFESTNFNLANCLEVRILSYQGRDLCMFDTRRKEINDLFYDGEDPVFLRLRNGWDDPILSEEKETILNFSRELCKAINSGNFDKEDLLLIFCILSDLSNFPESIEAGELLNDLFRGIKYSLDNS